MADQASTENVHHHAKTMREVPSITDAERWPDVLLWMEDTQLRLRAAIDAVGGMPKL